jgi:hypothetical protein
MPKLYNVDETMDGKDEVEKTFKEAVLPHFKNLSGHISGRGRKKPLKPEDLLALSYFFRLIS